MFTPNRNLKSFLTIEGSFKSKRLIIALPKRYIPADGCIDEKAVHEDGYDVLVTLPNMECCYIESLKSSEAGIKISITDLSPSPRQMTRGEYEDMLEGG